MLRDTEKRGFSHAWPRISKGSMAFLGVSMGVAMETERRELQRGKALVKGGVRENQHPERPTFFTRMLFFQC